MGVRVEDGLDRVTVPLLGGEPGVDVAHGGQIPGDATGRDAASHGGVIGGDGHGAGDDGEWLGPESGCLPVLPDGMNPVEDLVRGDEQGEPPVG
jgi:hypothetical protein